MQPTVTDGLSCRGLIVPISFHYTVGFDTYLSKRQCWNDSMGSVHNSDLHPRIRPSARPKLFSNRVVVFRPQIGHCARQFSHAVELSEVTGQYCTKLKKQ